MKCSDDCTRQTGCPGQQPCRRGPRGRNGRPGPPGPAGPQGPAGEQGPAGGTDDFLSAYATPPQTGADGTDLIFDRNGAASGNAISHAANSPDVVLQEPGTYYVSFQALREPGNRRIRPRKHPAVPDRERKRGGGRVGGPYLYGPGDDGSPAVLPDRAGDRRTGDAERGGPGRQLRVRGDESFRGEDPLNLALLWRAYSPSRSKGGVYSSFALERACMNPSSSPRARAASTTLPYS